MNNWRPRLILGGIVLVMAIVLRIFGINTFVESVGWMAAGYLFGSAPVTKVK